MASTLELLRRLKNESVDFILVGGLAAIAHGSASVTEDVDVLVRFDVATVSGILRALKGTNPRQRMSPARPPLGDDPGRFIGNQNLDVTCDWGTIDFLGELTGFAGWDEVSRNAVTMKVAELELRVISLADLIKSKRAVARPKDLRVARELELVLERASKRAGEDE